MEKTAVELVGKNRKTGRHNNRSLRKQGWVPGIVYGPKVSATPCLVDERFLVKYGRQEFINQFIDLKIDGKAIGSMGVLIKCIDVDPVTQRPIHVDFFAPDSSTKIKVKVKVNFDGKSKGVADGGYLQPINQFVELQCLPHQIPEAVMVDVTPMGIGSTFKASQLTLGEGVSLACPRELPLIAVRN